MPDEVRHSAFPTLSDEPAIREGFFLNQFLPQKSARPVALNLVIPPLYCAISVNPKNPFHRYTYL